MSAASSGESLRDERKEEDFEDESLPKSGVRDGIVSNDMAGCRSEAVSAGERGRVGRELARLDSRERRSDGRVTGGVASRRRGWRVAGALL